MSRHPCWGGLFSDATVLVSSLLLKMTPVNPCFTKWDLSDVTLPSVVGALCVVSAHVFISSQRQARRAYLPRRLLFSLWPDQRDLQRRMFQRWAGKDGCTVTQGPRPKLALVLGTFMACLSSEFFLALNLTCCVTLGPQPSLAVSVSPAPRQQMIAGSQTEQLAWCPWPRVPGPESGPLGACVQVCWC